MKHFFTLTVALFFIHSLHSQNWKLFNKDQKSIYLQRYKEALKAESFIPDSLREYNGGEVLYFNAKSDLHQDCYDKIKKRYFEINPYGKNQNKIDSLFIRKDSVFFVSDIFSKKDTFLFKPMTDVGSSWNTNGLTIQCVEKSWKDVFGIMDSVKTFRCITLPFDTIEFVVSKNYGFVKFWPLNEFIVKSNDNIRTPYFELIGFTNENISRGYQQPDFKDYFHLSKGDILYWEQFYIDSPFPIQHTLYHIDTVSYVYSSSDSVYYEFNGSIYKNGVVTGVYQNKSAYYLKRDEGEIVQSSTSWFGFVRNYGEATSDIYFFGPLELSIEGSDTITTVQLTISTLQFDKNECKINIVMDYDRTLQFSTREGHILTASYSWGASAMTLIGSIISGNKTGITDIPTSILKPVESSSLAYPNPVNDVLHFRLAEPAESIEIFDISYHLISTQPFKESINLSELKPGIYVVKVNSSKYAQFARIVKQ